jgi:hypothetical protein
MSITYLAGVQRLHSESLRSTQAPASVVGATDRNTRLCNWYADAWRELQSERDWRWMRTTLDSALTVDLQTYSGVGLGASRFGRWRREDSHYNPYLYIAGAPNAIWPMTFWNLDEFRARFIYRQWGSSTPIAWTFDENNQLLVGPPPRLPYQLRVEYWKEPFELLADADTPDMPDRFALVPMWRALQEVAKADATPEVLVRAEMNYRDLHLKLFIDQARVPEL